VTFVGGCLVGSNPVEKKRNAQKGGLTAGIEENGAERARPKVLGKEANQGEGPLFDLLPRKGGGAVQVLKLQRKKKSI